MKLAQLLNDFDAAAAELGQWLTDRVAAHGITFETCANAPSTFEELCQRCPDKRVLVPNFAEINKASVYVDPALKCYYQCWHDHQHVTSGFDFSYEGERKLAKVHDLEAIETGLSENARVLLQAESIGRVRYFFKWGRFPRNERLHHFVFFADGPDAAVNNPNL